MAGRDRYGKKDRVLSGFGKGDAPTPGTARPERKPRRDPGDAPKGYDQDCWTLAIKFQQAVMSGHLEDVNGHHIELAQDLPVIHDVIKELVDRFGIRSQEFRQATEPCDRRKLPGDMAARCWLHWPPFKPGEQQPGPLRWTQVVEVIMAEFFSRCWDEHALSHFKQYFGEYGQAAMDHWRSLTIIGNIDRAKAARGPRDIMHRVKPGASMTSDSEEG